MNKATGALSRIRVAVAFVFLFVLSALLPGTTGAKANPEKRQIEALKRQFEEYQKTADANNRRFAESMAVIDSLRGTVQALQGQGDEHTHYIETGMKKVEEKIAEYENRIRQAEGRVAQFATQMEEVLSGASGKTPKKSEVIQKYSRALIQFNRQNYSESIASLREFQKEFPKDSWEDNAQYWIGQGYFEMGDYEKSILEFQKGIDRFPRGERVSDALLMQGYAFVELGALDDAKAFLSKVVRSYPRSDEAARAKRQLEFLARK